MRLASPDKTSGIQPGAVIRLAKITVTKVVDSGSATADQWCFTVTGPNSYNLTQCVPSGQSSVDFIGLQSGSYTVTESNVAGYSFASGSGTNCTFSGSTATATVTAAAGGATNASCTFHNAQALGSIELRKSWVGPGGQTTLRIGTSTGGSQIASQLTGANGGAPLTTGAKPVAPLTYFVSETGGLAGFSSSLACFNDNGAGGGTPNDGTQNGGEPTVSTGANGSVAVAANDDIVCTFNRREDHCEDHADRHHVPDGSRRDGATTADAR